MPSTVRIELNKLGYDWERGALLAEHGSGRTSTPGQGTRYIKTDDPVLDTTFSNGSGCIDVPRVFARDKGAVYFPHVSAVAGTRFLRIPINPEHYLKSSEPLPYPGDD